MVTSGLPASTGTVLIVDDDRRVRNALSRALGLESYKAITASGGREALTRIAERQFDAVVLDVAMPEVDGLSVCRQLRSVGDTTPVLMLTARDRLEDRVSGLDAGADDYLVKPFDLAEFLARLRAVMRRNEPARGVETLRFADIRMELHAHEAYRGQRLLELTATEYRLLQLFVDHPRHVLERSLIFERIWGYDFGPASNSLGVYIGYLRRKLESDGEPRLLHTVRSVGYVLRES